MEFTFNNKNSKEFNIKIKKSNHLSIPRRKLEFVEVQGRTDNLVVDEDSREMLDIEIEAYMDCRNEDTYSYALELDEWLNNASGYQNLIFDDGVELKAIFVGQIDFNSITKNFEEILLQFKACVFPLVKLVLILALYPLTTPLESLLEAFITLLSLSSKPNIKP